MKNKLLLLGLCLSLMGCSEDATTPVDNTPAENNVLLLKVDLLTSAFEGGKELTFDAAENFTISHEYETPGDFGGIKLKYNELNAPLFEGTIHWMGLGAMSYPQIDPPSAFSSSEILTMMPDASHREIVQYTEYPMPYNEEPYAPDYEALWGAVSSLHIVKDYRAANPNSKVYFFLYTPSVGVGDPADWDWFIILKN
ncbi:hypothetical protein R1T16_11400 [Flavobacterium sp. DG1-102-2]|uniref:hypothetical protein n=1 Tax=Flavobacterium sp. DG1-102-2 TaxID=3081663 RepID=UPI00294925BE|nr:hypothetical protein [Flavobacterium sp. DG1-102-2]MDV6169035.1 hypothetical protein [Flavobacterium sp. DG1-102-2]